MPLPDLKKKTTVPKKCIAADRFLRKWYPNFWNKIQGYKNNQYISEVEYTSKILMWLDFYGINFDRIKKHLFDFIGIKQEPVDVIPKKKRLMGNKPYQNSCRVLNKRNQYSF